MPIRPKEPWDKDNVWTTRVDEEANLNGYGGLVLKSPQGEKIGYALKFEFPTTNNEAEYEALIVGLTLAKEYGMIHMDIYSDSQLIVNQVVEEYQSRWENMTLYLAKVESLLQWLAWYRVTQVLREKNLEADSLTQLASDLDGAL